jgi:integrase
MKSELNPTSFSDEQLLAILRDRGPDLVQRLLNETSSVPTVREYLTTVQAVCSEGAAETYTAYWKLMVRMIGDLPLDSVKASDLKKVATCARKNCVKRSNSRDGLGAEENCVGAMRNFFAAAVNDALLDENLALKVPKPHRRSSRRRALTADEQVELYDATVGGGDDPLLDALLLRFHLETGARRGGALALRRRDVDIQRQCVRLREKGVTERWQPVSLTLLSALIEHAAARGCISLDDRVFRKMPRGYSSVGDVITRRRYNSLVERWHRKIPWAAEYGVSIHWCRHTGHLIPGDVTTSYITADVSEVAAAVSIYTGEPHPLAPGQ